jgi:ferredoxin
VENFIAIFGAPSEKLRDERLAMQGTATKEAVAAIESRLSNRVPRCNIFFKIVSALFRLARPAMRFLFRVNDNCNACGFCARLCPVCAITMTAAGPVFQKNCEQCQACLNFCPRNAIGFGKLKANTTRYHHPDVTAAELFCQTKNTSHEKHEQHERS